MIQREFWFQFSEAFNEIEVKYKGGLVTIKELESTKTDLEEENDELKGIVQVIHYYYLFFAWFSCL